MDTCTHFKGLMIAEAEIIKESIEFHKYCNHFETTDEAISDFLSKYGWIMRTMYCKSACPNKNICDLQNQGL